MPLHTPILFLIFNRPDTTAQVFQSIRNARPSRLYIAADGPRSNKIGEKEICEEVRQIATNVDWPCEVFTLFRQENLGCGKAVSSAIKWFFDNEPQGIILEDDCLPHDDFYFFCEYMLNKYRDEKRIQHIGGTSFIGSKVTIDTSYYFSMFVHVWGWASWNDRWENYQFDVSRLNVSTLLEGYKHDKRYIAYFEDRIKRMLRGKINTWDYQWLFTMWSQKAVSIIPKSNLVLNIGTDSGTHMNSTNVVNQAKLEKFKITNEPESIEINDTADCFMFNENYYRPYLKINKLKNKIKNFFKTGI